MDDDAALLRRYADTGAEEAFAELVRRHLDLVYSAALRQLNGDAHLAADAAQLVFADLARKARTLLGHRVLAGWLFTSTRFAAAKLVRGERRRHAREQEAQLMQELSHDDPAAQLDWQRARPVLDDALEELGAIEREAILLRFFEGRDYAAVGARLNLADNAARMRVERALDKLRTALARRGVTSTTSALAVALANQAVIAAPAGLAATVTGAALGAGAAVAVGGSIMMATKLQLGLAAAIAAAGVTGWVVQAESAAGLRAEIADLQQQNREIAALEAENAQLARTAREIADLREDDATLGQLREEAAALKARLQAAGTRAVRADAGTAPRPRAALSGAVFDLNQLDRAPQPKFQARPMYPAEMRAGGQRGEVVVDFVVDDKGDVQNASALRSSRPEFEASAVEAVSRWKFQPGQKTGAAVNTHMQIPIVFTMAGDSPPQSAGAAAANRPAGADKFTVATPSSDSKPRPPAPAPWF